MAWTYSGDPSKSDRDWVRWRVGDTDSSDKLQTDAEIDAAVTTYGTKYLAAAQIALSIAAGYARRVDTAMGKLKISHSQRVQYWTDFAMKLQAEADLTGVAPWAGGISKDSKQEFEADTDRVEPSFAVGMHDTVEGQHASETTSTSDWVRA